MANKYRKTRKPRRRGGMITGPNGTVSQTKIERESHNDAYLYDVSMSPP